MKIRKKLPSVLKYGALLLTIILNVANYVSTDSDLKQTLTLIYENAGTIPHSRFLPPSGSDTLPDRSAPSLCSRGYHAG